MKAKLIIRAGAACLLAFYMARYGLPVGDDPTSWPDGR